MKLRRSIVAFLVVAFGGCSLSDCEPPEELRPRKKVSTPPLPDPLEPGRFGGHEPGFVEWLSADGDTVVLQRFYKDTNGDGEVTARLGDHGEVAGDDPVVEVHDLVRGTVEIFDELVAAGPRQRSIVLRRGDVIELIDTSTDQRTELPATHEGDAANPCLPARQAVFGPAGERIAFITKDGRPAVYRFATQNIEIFQRVEGLWRVGAPPLDGAVVVQVVRKDTDGDGVIEPPRARTTCPSRWAAQFAASLGRYGWAGDEFQQRLVFPNGRSVEFDGNLVPVGEDAVWGPRGGVTTLAGESIPIGERCELASVPLGESEVLVRCDGRLGLWDPGAGPPRLLEENAEPTEPVSVPARPDASQAWVAIEVDAPDGKRIGRLDLRTARLDIGPLADGIGRPHSSGWVLITHRDNGLSAFDLNTGTTTNIGLKAYQPNGLTVSVGEATHVVDPLSGRTTETDRAPRFVAANGCFVDSEGDFPPFDRGPWFLKCPK